MNKRLEVMDVLRGFSLLGILIANMLYFQYSSTTKDKMDLNTWWDQGAYYFTKIFVEGSFYPIFGFLFGYGVILFIQALENRDVSVKGPWQIPTWPSTQAWKCCPSSTKLTCPLPVLRK